jgi:hypothetical protein
MHRTSYLLIICFFFVTRSSFGQVVKLGSYEFEAVGAIVSKETIMNKPAVKVIMDSSIHKADEPTFARLKNINFSNGIIEVKVLSRLLKSAPEFARGFIGLAFHINDSNTRFESIYLRPTNARAADQVRRNHSIQYYAYPDYKFDRLRKEAPERYESYADMELNHWITMRIEVKDGVAKLFLNDNKQPSLIVNDLKLGANSGGSIGLWVDTGTEGYFSDLKIMKK